MRRQSMPSRYRAHRVATRNDLRHSPTLVIVAPLPPTAGSGEDLEPPHRLRDSSMHWAILSLMVNSNRRLADYPRHAIACVTEQRLRVNHSRYSSWLHWPHLARLLLPTEHSLPPVDLAGQVSPRERLVSKLPTLQRLIRADR